MAANTANNHANNDANTANSYNNDNLGEPGGQRLVSTPPPWVRTLLSVGQKVLAVLTTATALALS